MDIINDLDKEMDPFFSKAKDHKTYLFFEKLANCLLDSYLVVKKNSDIDSEIFPPTTQSIKINREAFEEKKKKLFFEVETTFPEPINNDKSKLKGLSDINIKQEWAFLELYILCNYICGTYLLIGPECEANKQIDELQKIYLVEEKRLKKRGDDKRLEKLYKKKAEGEEAIHKFNKTMEPKKRFFEQTFGCDMTNIEMVGLSVSAKCHELLGYWTAKMEERKRNLENVSIKTKKRLVNKEMVKEILSENKFIVDQSIIIRAMTQIDRGERTVKNIIKELKKEIL